MNAHILEAHLELHRMIMEVVKAKVPKTFVGTFKDVYTLSDVTADEDGILRAEYSRYEGCGSYAYETVVLDPYKLFQEAA